MLYATAVMLSVLLTGSAMTLVAIAVVDRRVQSNLSDQRAASMLVRTGSEWIQAYATNNPTWRSDFKGNGAKTLKPSGPGRVDVALSDGDGDLTDNDTQMVSVTSTSRVNGLDRVMKFDGQSKPHAALAYNIMATSSITIAGNCSINGPLYAGSSITKTAGTVTTGQYGSYNVPSGGSITATLTPQNTTATAVPSVAPDLTFYTKKATSLALSNGGSGYKLEKCKLSSTFNTFGAANAYGIYIVDMAGQSLTLRELYVEGTLVIINSGASAGILIDKPVIFKPGTFGYPVLIISAGSTTVDVLIPASTLDENSVSADLNNDGDKVDSLTPYITGLVYAPDCSTTLNSSSWAFNGSLISRSVTINGGVLVGDGTTLAAQRTPGFTDALLHPIAGTTSEVLP